jgi:glucose-1-phosphate cytidylyltransferase
MMKVVILAGGYGTRLSEDSEPKPKPMVEIGDKPILWHIMKYYSCFGFNDFIVCLGYKGYVIKEYFVNYYLHQSNIRIDLSKNSIQTLNTNSEPWKITLVDTGLHTMTGGRIKKIREYLNDDKFLLTYGDGLSDLNLNELIEAHNKYKALVTVTAARPKGRFGVLDIDDKQVVTSFREKNLSDSGWINGGFFVCEQGIFDYLEDDETVWERKPLENMSGEGKLFAFKHEGFWSPMDTPKDRRDLNQTWMEGKAPWKIWK